MNELVTRLSIGDHRVEFSSKLGKNVATLSQCIARGYVHVNFPDTRGGTELGVRLDKERTDLSKGNLTDGNGTINLVGDLTLNYVKVRCFAHIDLSTFEGRGRLEAVEENS